MLKLTSFCVCFLLVMIAFSACAKVDGEHLSAVQTPKINWWDVSSFDERWKMIQNLKKTHDVVVSGRVDSIEQQDGYRLVKIFVQNFYKGRMDSKLIVFRVANKHEFRVGEYYLFYLKNKDGVFIFDDVSRVVAFPWMYSEIEFLSDKINSMWVYDVPVTSESCSWKSPQRLAIAGREPVFVKKINASLIASIKVPKQHSCTLIFKDKSGVQYSTFFRQEDIFNYSDLCPHHIGGEYEFSTFQRASESNYTHQLLLNVCEIKK